MLFGIVIEYIFYEKNSLEIIAHYGDVNDGICYSIFTMYQIVHNL